MVLGVDVVTGWVWQRLTSGAVDLSGPPPESPPPAPASTAAMRLPLRIGVATLIGIAATTYARWGCLHTLDDAALAERLLESRAVLCTPKIVERVDEGVLRVVCADGKYAFAQAMSCSESFACEFLGFDAACWESVPLPTRP